ncbi:hypothetical protein [Candidatus Soleaferrea massiliensis]|uniref:hypothetical protein n=1 Tax=Candidatus Soleaferrea massiliensis TaxID=1470354 RepID=UPI00058FA562|nr:hypothetical protein [Candidatus Soleaferrea massiliensis]
MKKALSVLCLCATLFTLFQLSVHSIAKQSFIEKGPYVITVSSWNLTKTLDHISVPTVLDQTISNALADTTAILPEISADGIEISQVHYSDVIGSSYEVTAGSKYKLFLIDKNYTRTQAYLWQSYYNAQPQIRWSKINDKDCTITLSYISYYKLFYS